MGKQILCCFKIKSATLFLGIIDLMIHLVIIVSLLSSMQRFDRFDFDLHNNYLASQHSPAFQLSIESNQISPPTPATNQKVAVDETNKLPSEVNGWYNNGLNGIRTRQNRPIGLLVIVCSTLIILMHIYGIMKNKPSYLMPYFSIKVFQVVLLCLTTLSFYSCLPNLRTWIENSNYIAYKDTLLRMDRQQLELAAFAVLLLSIVIKLYEVIIVWYCYRYMVTVKAFNNLRLMSATSNHNNNHMLDELIYTGIGGESSAKIDDAFLINAPPKYDEIVAQSQRVDAAAAADAALSVAVRPSTSTAQTPASLNTINETGKNSQQNDEIMPLNPPDYKSIINVKDV